MKGFFFNTFILIALTGRGQTEWQDNYKEALLIVKKLNAYYGYSKQAAELKYHVEYTGVSFESGHFSYPEQQYMDSVTFKILSDGKGRFLINKDLVYKEKHYESFVLYKGDSCYTTDYWSDRKWVVKIDQEAFVQFYIPLNLLSKLNGNMPAVHVLESTNELAILGFNDRYGNKYYINVDMKEGRIEEVKQYKYDPIYGDISRVIRYNGIQKENGISFPKTIVELENGFFKEKLNLQLTELPFTKSDSSLLSLAAVQHANDTSIGCDEIAPNLYLVKLYDSNNKMLVAKHDEFLSVYDAPGNIHTGNKLLGFFKNKFDLPVKYCFISHHHPDHGGGVAAFNEIGAKIITTKGNTSFFDKVSSVSHSFYDPALEKQNPKSNYVLIDSASSKTFFKKTQLELDTYEVGAETHHTNEYLLFYFKKLKILFVPDLVFFPEDKVRDQKKRAYAVYQFIKQEKLNVEKIVTGWPLKGQKIYGTMHDLILALKKNYPEVK